MELRIPNGFAATADDLGAVLLERCKPGTTLCALEEYDQDLVISALLRRLWRLPSTPHPFRSLSTLTEYWTNETLGQIEHWPDIGLVREGLQLFKELPRNATRKVLLATDLHAGNVLRAEREPWLVIDPKPFVGDPAYDATQHLLNCVEDCDRIRIERSEALQPGWNRTRTCPALDVRPRSGGAARRLE